MQDAVILAAVRTPVGSFLGGLSALSACQLGAVVIRAALERCAMQADSVEQIIMGNVLQAGLGQAPARQAGLYGGIPSKAGAITVHKVCGSGLRAVMDANNGIRVGEWEVLLAGGMESMSNAPHLLSRSRFGYRMGDVQLMDSMLKDGLWDPYSDRHMGSCAEACATKYKFSREEQDAFALHSYKKAQAAIAAGKFSDEIASVQVPQKKGDPIAVAQDEEPFAAPLEKMPQLRPAFEKNGTITAANASKLNDGASALVLTSAEKAEDLGKAPLARVVSHATVAQDPEWFTTAPTAAALLALKRAGLKPQDVHRWEINEAFAVVPMAAIVDLGIDPKLVNVRGGAIALGHPIGASGARLLTTLVHILVQEKLRYGCVSICIGGGEAAAMVVENLAL